MSATPTDLELAITDWLTEAVEDVTLGVSWANFNGSKPEYPYVSVTRVSSRRVGLADQVQRFVDMTRPEGQQVELRRVKLREVRYSLQVFVANADMVGENSAQALADGIRDSLQEDDVLAAFQEVDASPILDDPPVHDIPSLRKVSFEGRSQLDIGFYVVRTSSKFVPLIKSIQGQLVAGGKTTPLDITLPE